ncbi:MAG: GNAT family N-acetyltransferase [Nitrospinales bacterium]
MLEWARPENKNINEHLKFCGVHLLDSFFLEPKDVGNVQAFVKSCEPLGIHTAFTYWVLAKYFNNTCFILEKNSQIIGWIAGVTSSSHESTLYIWQIGVAPEHRGKKYSENLIDAIVFVARNNGCKSIHFSISPQNIPCLKAFERYARLNKISMKGLDKVEIVDSSNNVEDVEILYQFKLTPPFLPE